MLVKNKGAFFKSIFLISTFIIVLIIMFLPIFNGKNALEAADRLFNSIAKGSTDFIPHLIAKNKAFKGTALDVTLNFQNQGMADNAVKLLTASGVKTVKQGTKLAVKGDLGSVLGAALSDSQAMFNNNDESFKKKYDLSGKEALFVWWNVLKQIDKDLTKQKKFKQAKFVSDVVKKGVEVGYNFFNIPGEAASSKAGALAFAMIFYVIYTLWWGMGILFLFEGFGFQLTARAKKEV
ncbi:MAG: hypothetical protein P8182_18080 [Deltaproteobacteria bacterium]